MKSKIFNIAAAVVISFAASSCTDKFDPSTYAPPLSIDGYTSTKQVAPESLVAHWAFDGGLSDSVSKVIGAATGASFTSGAKGQGFQGAANGYVLSNTPDAVQNLKSFTATLWFKSAQVKGGAVALVDIANANADWGNLTIFLDGGNETTAKLKVHVNNAGTDAWLGAYDLSNAWDKWNQLAVSYDQSTSTFITYFNGTKIATATVANYGPINFRNAGKMVFGTFQFQTDPSLTSTMGKQDWGKYLTGQLDEVRIYNKALSASEVSVLQRLEARGK